MSSTTQGPDVGGDGAPAVESVSTTNGAGGPHRGRIVAALAAVAVIVIAGVVVLLTRDDGDDQQVSTPATNPPATSPSPSTATTPPATAPTDTSTAVWPVTGSSTRYTDPVAAATGFATDFVGFVDPVVGTFQQGDSRSGEVSIRARAQGPVTTVFVRQLGDDGSWWVLGSATPNIQVTTPAALATISSPATLTGTSTAFEATVNVQVREDGNATPIGKGFVMGGANGVTGAFDGTVTFTQPSAQSGAVVFMTLSAEDGRVSEAGVVRVKFS